MLRNNAHAHRCSYFELGLPVVRVVALMVFIAKSILLYGVKYYLKTCSSKWERSSCVANARKVSPDIVVVDNNDM